MAQAVSPAKQAGTKKRPARGLSGRTRSGLFLNQDAADGRQRTGSQQAETDGHPAIRVTLSGSYTASVAGITVNYEKRGRGAPICSLARELVEAGHDPAAPLFIYRGASRCFNPLPLGKWAGLTVEEGDSTPRQARFGKHRLRASEPAAGSADSAAAVGQFSGHLAFSGGEVPEKASAAPAVERHP